MPDQKKAAAGEKKGRAGLIFLIIAGLAVIGIAVVMALNLGGIREDYVMRYLRGAPVIGAFFPAPPEEPDEAETLTFEELMQRYNVARMEIEGQEARISGMLIEAERMQARINDLEHFENERLEYQAAKALFDQIIVHGDPAGFLEFFEFVSPENHLLLGREAVQLAEYRQSLMEIVRTFNNMEEALVGQTLENLMLIDTPLVLAALREMSVSRRAEIFDTLEYTVVARLTILLAEPPPQFIPLTPPFLAEPPRDPIVVPDDVLDEMLGIGEEEGVDGVDAEDAEGLGDEGVDGGEE